MNISRRILGWSFGLLAVLSVGIGSYFYTQYSQKEYCIYEYNEKRDHDFILNLFKDKENWYWLVAEGSDFSPEYFLEHRASSKKPEHLGNETIKVIYAQGKPVGFTSYYQLKFYEGRIHFVAVDKQHRSKSYGFILTKYALEDLLKRGTKKISLVTRTTNIPAQTIYKKAGFKEGRVVNGFVYFDYYVKQD